jgi:DNA-binding transcriptional regulator YiaG
MAKWVVGEALTRLYRSSMPTIDDAAALRQIREVAANGYARTVRLHAGLSLREVADAIDVDPSTVHRWEHGDRRPRGPAALRYGKLIDRLVRGGRP